MDNSSLFNIKDKVVVVTGGLGQLGQQFMRTLLGQDARVVCLDMDDSVERLSSDLQEQVTKDRLMLTTADVTKTAEIKDVLQTIEQKWGVPYGLINNAALDSPPSAAANNNLPFEQYDMQLFDRIMDVNVNGVVQCCQAFGSRMAEVGQGSIINISSIYGLLSPDQSLYQYRRERGEAFYKPVSYAVSKSALYNLTRYLATYWGGKGVRVNTLSFGGVFNQQDDEFLQGYAKRTPLGRMANPDEYNGAIVFLLSQASSYMTGSNMVIDGGFSAW